MKFNRYLFLVLFLLLCVLGRSQEKTKALQALFQPLDSAGAFNGTVLIADSGKIIYEAAYGYANFNSKVKNTLKTKFEIASLSKQFTALAIMQLHQTGKLGYNDKITKFFPKLPYKEVTIGDLIHHSSGIPDFLGWTKSQMASQKVQINNEDVIKMLPILAPKTMFAPGTAFSYSNTNYLLLASLVQKLSGEPFAEYMQTHIFKKTGMLLSSVGSAKVKQNDNEAASQFMWDPLTNRYQAYSEIIPEDYYNLMAGTYGHSGIQTTVTDLFKWTQALRNNTLVPDSIFAAAFTPVTYKNGKGTVGTDQQMPYTFGWILILKDNPDQNFLFHTGGIGGYRSFIVFYPKANRVIITLQNIDMGVAIKRLMPTILQILDGSTRIEQPEIPRLPKADPISQDTLQKLTGLYVAKEDSSIRIRITTKNDRLYARYRDQISFEVYPKSNHLFFFNSADATLDFEGGQANGNYHAVTLLQNGLKIYMIRQE